MQTNGTGRGLPALALLGASLLGCGRCSSGASPAPVASAPSSSAESAPVVAPTAAPAGSDLPALPELTDTGRGRATVALRAVLSAYGVAFDAPTLERECKVDDEGASIDDLEDVARKYGLEATQLLLPPEHVFLEGSQVLPAIVIAEGDDETLQFALAWRLEGDGVVLLDPAVGRRSVPRAELVKRLELHELSMAAEDFRAMVGSAGFRDALRARATALGIERPAAEALLDQAAAGPGWEGPGAVDAALRQLESDPAKAAGGALAALTAAVECSRAKRGTCGIDPELWSAQRAPKGPPGELVVRGAVVLAIAGRRAP